MDSVFVYKLYGSFTSMIYNVVITDLYIIYIYEKYIIYISYLVSRLLQIIYVSRDPKDAAVSYFHHHRLWSGYTGTFDDFMEAFLNDLGKLTSMITEGGNLKQFVTKARYFTII